MSYSTRWLGDKEGLDSSISVVPSWAYDLAGLSHHTIVNVPVSRHNAITSQVCSDLQRLKPIRSVFLLAIHPPMTVGKLWTDCFKAGSNCKSRFNLNVTMSQVLPLSVQHSLPLAVLIKMPYHFVSSQSFRCSQESDSTADAKKGHVFGDKGRQEKPVPERFNAGTSMSGHAGIERRCF